MAKQEKILISVDLDRSAAEKQILENTKSLRSLKEETTSLNKQLKEGKITEDEFTKSILANQKATKDLQDQNKQLTNVIKSADNTVEGLRARINALSAEANKLDLNSEEFTKAQEELKGLNEQLIEIGKGRSNFKDNIGNYGSSIEDLEEKLKELNSVAKTVEIGSEDFKIAQKEIQAVKDKLDDANQALGETSKTTISAAEGLDSMVPGLGSAAGGFKEMTMQALRFIATPLGAILAAIVGVFQLLKTVVFNSTDAMDKFEDVTAAVSTILDIVVDRLVMFVEGISSFLSGNFSEGLDKMGNSFKGIGDEIEREVGLALGLANAIRELEDSEIAYEIAASKNENTIKRLLLQAKNRTLSEKERIDLLDEAMKLEQEQTDQLIKNKEEALRIANEEAALRVGLARIAGESESEYGQRIIETGKVLDDQRDKIKEAIIARNQAEGESLALQEKIQNQRDALVEKELENARKLAEEKRKLELQRLTDQEAALQRQLLSVEKNSQSELDLQIDLNKIRRDIQLQGEELTKEQRLLITAQAFAAEQELTVDFLATQKELRLKAINEQLQLIEEGEHRKALILQDAYLRGQIDEQTFNERLFEIRQQALLDEIAQYEEGSLLKLEKEVELEQLRADRLNEIRDKSLEDDKKRQAAEQELDNIRLQTAQEVTDGIIALAGEKSIAGKAALAIQKGLALAEIAMNLGTELSNVGKADSAFPTPVGPALIAGRTALAIVRAASAAAKVAAVSFDIGGIDGNNIAHEGGLIPRLGGMIRGRSHREGGVRFRMRNGRLGEADGKKGEAYIVNTNNDPRLKAMASAINEAGGGRPFFYGGIDSIKNLPMPSFNSGGIVTFDTGGIAAGVVGVPTQSTNDLVEVIKSIPSPRVLVDDIDSGLSTKVFIEDGATI